MEEESREGSSGTALIPNPPQPELSASASQLGQMLEVVERQILPKTTEQVAVDMARF